MRCVLGQVFVVGLILVTASGGSSAQNQPDAAKAQELLPYRDVSTPEEIQKNFRPQQFTPFGDRKFYFEILVPNGWESHLSDVDPDQVTQDKQAPVQVADFEPSGADDLGVQVSYMRVPEQTTLDQFMTTYAQKSGGTVVARQQAEFKGHAVEDALLRVNSDDLGPMLTRATAVRHGDLVFIVTGGSVEGKYESYKRLFGAVVTTFEPLGK
jgi:hypothetical protein